MRYYLLGPMRNDDERAVLQAAEQALRANSFQPPFGPHDVSANPPDPDRIAKERMRLLAAADAVCLVDGWASDHVSEFEHHVARRLGMKCTPLCILLSQHP